MAAAPEALPDDIEALKAALVQKYDNTYPGGSDATMSVTGAYEIE